MDYDVVLNWQHRFLRVLVSQMASVCQRGGVFGVVPVAHILEGGQIEEPVVGGGGGGRRLR